jgi:predicted pyridoxine 5'-phosphate oxidase superfamily flavin-nucleotide-binding protein
MAPTPEFTSDVAFTEAVKRVQSERGSRTSYARMEQSRGGFAGAITPEIAAYIAQANSAYLATANAAGQPYVQHRGGPAGFIKVLNEHTLAFADFAGNRQYVTTGNLAENDRAFLFIMNYEEGERVKIWGHAQVIPADADFVEKLVDPGYDAKIEQAIIFRVSAWDANCSQHIPKLISAERVNRTLGALRQRTGYLEATLRAAGVPFAEESTSS